MFPVLTVCLWVPRNIRQKKELWMNNIKGLVCTKWFLLTLGVFLIVACACALQPYTPDSHTILLDHFDNTNLGVYVSGTMNYVDGFQGSAERLISLRGSG